MMTLTQPPQAVNSPVNEQGLWAVGMRPFSLDSHRPDWLVQAQQQAQNALGVMGFPSQKSEAWRHISLDRLSRQTFQPSPAQSDAVLLRKPLEAYLYAESAQSRRVILNGHAVVSDFESLQALPEGVFLGSFQQFLESNPNPAALDWVKTRLGHSSDDALTALNTAQLQDIQILVVPDDVQLTAPVQVLFVSADFSGLVTVNYPRLMVYAGERSQSTVLVQYMAMANPASAYWTNGAVDISAGAHAQMDVALTQTETESGLHTVQTNVVQNADSTVRMFSIQLGAHLARHQIDWTLDGERAHGVVDGLTVTHGKAEAHHHVTVRHTVPNAQSEQLFKSVLGGTSRAGFDGTIEIVEGAQNTDASQLNKNLLLSGEARAITRPQLRISADDVRCSHGATVGQLSEAELFYLQSRGISREAAVTTLTFGFAEDLIEKVPVASMRKHLKALVHRNLDSELGICIHRKEAR